MSVNWQRIRIPLMERLALADMATRRNKSEREVLVELICEAVKRELATGGHERTPREVRE